MNPYALNPQHELTLYRVFPVPHPLRVYRRDFPVIVINNEVGLVLAWSLNDLILAVTLRWDKLKIPRASSNKFPSRKNTDMHA